ncbi:MAG: nickel-dependent hydrogenase large subunit [Campylobacteraceae bacterium]|nr:nickel-dependent hydrogenase large subunit [Campylobacteraceae bacterium]
MKTVDIVERIEGEAKLVCQWEKEKISDVKIQFLNFRGFEFILKDKPALDALVYTPRICGICGQAHLKATVESLENIYKNHNEKLTLTNKAKLLREIGLNIEIIDSHIKWFYMFIMPDVVKFSNNSLDEYSALKGKKWLEASNIASETIKSLAIIGGQWPHTSYMIPGGVVSDPTLLDLATMQNYMDQAIRFYENSLVGNDLDTYLNFNKSEDLYKVKGDLKDFITISFENEFEKIGKSYDRHLVLGDSLSFEKGKISKKLTKNIDYENIEEFTMNSFDIDKSKVSKEAYTWSKTALYANNFYETGPLSRAVVQDRSFVSDIHKHYSDSMFTRVLARMDELGFLLFKTKELIKQIDINEESFIKPQVSLKDFRYGIGQASVEACRGSLYHDVEIENGIIRKYDVITPTVWNLGPGIDNKLSISQKAIVGTDSLEKAKLILRSFDVCSVCTTH